MALTSETQPSPNGVDCIEHERCSKTIIFRFKGHKAYKSSYLDLVVPLGSLRHIKS